MGVGNHYTEIANVFLKFKKKNTCVRRANKKRMHTETKAKHIANLHFKDLQHRKVSCEIRKIFKNIYFEKHQQMAASPECQEIYHSVKYLCSNFF